MPAHSQRVFPILPSTALYLAFLRFSIRIIFLLDRRFCELDATHNSTHTPLSSNFDVSWASLARGRLEDLGGLAVPSARECAHVVAAKMTCKGMKGKGMEVAEEMGDCSLVIL